MTLNDCTRAELLFVIDSLKRHHFSNGDYYLSLALLEVEAMREERSLTDAAKYSFLSSEKRQAYIQLMKPYEGCPIGEIPHSVFARGKKLLDEAHEADRKWAKLMGVKLDQPKGDLK